MPLAACSSNGALPGQDYVKADQLIGYLDDKLANAKLSIEEAAAMLRKQISVTQMRVAMEQRLRQAGLMTLQRLYTGEQLSSCRAQSLDDLAQYKGKLKGAIVISAEPALLPWAAWSCCWNWALNAKTSG